MKTIVLVLLRTAFVVLVIGLTLTACLAVSNERELGMQAFELTGCITLPMLIGAMIIETVFDRA